MSECVCVCVCVCIKERERGDEWPSSNSYRGSGKAWETKVVNDPIVASM